MGIEDLHGNDEDAGGPQGHMQDIITGANVEGFAQRVRDHRGGLASGRGDFAQKGSVHAVWLVHKAPYVPAGEKLSSAK